MSELRRDVRLRTFLKGRIIFNNGNASMDCLVRDLSTTGARLTLSQTAVLPDAFELHIPAKDKVYRATLRWRRNDGVGVAFQEDRAGPAAAAAPSPGEPSVAALLRRIQDLEAENATLRRLVAEAEAAMMEKIG